MGNNTEQETRAKKPRRIPRGLVAACLALVLAGGGGGAWYYWQAAAVASIVSLDVNPSIELKVNRQERVLSCAPLNADAEQVLFEMDGGSDLEGAKLDVAVNAIVGALVRHGYLDSISSALLISVEDSDQARASRLQQQLTSSVAAMLQQQAAQTSIYGQTMTQGSGLEQLAQANGISSGKAALVNQIIARNDTLDFGELARLSVEELGQLIEVGAPGMPIGVGQAGFLAGMYAGTVALDSVRSEVDPKLNDPVPHYEVELHTLWEGFEEFEYKVDAYTGAILSGQADVRAYVESQGGFQGGTQNEPAAPVQSPAPEQTPAQPQPQAPTQTPAPQPSSSPAASGSITEADARKIALDDAGLSESQVTGLESDRDSDDGVVEYEVEFWYGSVEYEYTIRASDGVILKREQDNHGASSVPASPSAQSYIGESAAQNYALTHAGCSASDASYVNCWLEYDDGAPECYEVEFCVGNNCYEYEIDLYSGAVIKHECETYSGHHGGSHHSGGHH